MPELPEVETVCRGLRPLTVGKRIKDFKAFRKDLRFAIEPMWSELVKNQRVISIQRRAKYILFELESYFLINHLGMTGSWRVLLSDELPSIHDHLQISLDDDSNLIYQDPRRFGYIDLIKKTDLDSSRWFSHLGPEPLSEVFHPEYLFEKSRKKLAPVKSFLMDQSLVVGVGNIYVSEALYRSGVRPTRKAGQLSKNECELLCQDIKEVLSEAIEQGGSTIRDFKQAGGSSGYFQQKLYVYGKEGEACPVCAHPIFNVVLSGRSSYFCKQCQK